MSDDEAISARHANGRFMDGVCPNPKGRPRKPKIDIREILTAILQEEATTKDNRKISVLEVLCRTLVKEVKLHPKLLLQLIPLLVAPSTEPAPTAAPDDDQAVIQSLLDEEARRQDRLRAATDHQGILEPEDDPNEP